MKDVGEAFSSDVVGHESDTVVIFLQSWVSRVSDRYPMDMYARSVLRKVPYPRMLQRTKVHECPCACVLLVTPVL